jgi:hypothetical protein
MLDGSRAPGREARAFRWMMPGDLKLFHTAEEQAALVWAAADD